MPNKAIVKTEDFTKALSQIIDKYSVDTIENINDEILETANDIIDEIKKTAPRSTRNSKHLADGFIIETDEKTKTKEVTIYNKEKGYIAHFLEFGTVKTAPQPFMRNAYDRLVPRMMKKINEIIRSGKK